ncbi:aquaporin [Mycobacterium sp. NPDC048908]|uniref:aquaporin n=1 Tax=Mycobacterium sp. NPDC048908 TaxID=3364292 RepID=UPI003715A96A
MTIAPHWLDELHTSSALAENLRTLERYLVEAVGTFGLVLTVGVALCSRPSVATLGIGTSLMVLIYAGGYRVGAHLNPAITLAAALWGRIPLGAAAGFWITQLAAGAFAAIASKLVVGADQSQAVTEMMLGGRVLMLAFGAELLLSLVLAYVLFSCVEPRHLAPNSVWHLTIGVAVIGGSVDFAALFGGVNLVSQVIAGAFTAIAFLVGGSAAR